MGRKGKPVDATLKEQCLNLFQKGLGYSDIEKQTGIERRKVSVIIHGMEKESRLRELRSARRDVAAEFLKEHINDLGQASFYLLGIMLPDFWTSDLSVMPVNIQQRLLTHLKSDSFKPGALKLYSFPEKGFVEIPKYDPYMVAQVANPILADKLAKEMIIGMKEHLPELWPLVKQWEKSAREYNLVMNEILPLIKEAATGLTKNYKLLEAGIGRSIYLVSVENPDNEDESLLPNSAYKKDTKEYLAQKIIETRQTKQQLKRFRPALIELNDTYEKIVAMLGQSVLNKRLISGHCRYCPVD